MKNQMYYVAHGLPTYSRVCQKYGIRYFFGRAKLLVLCDKVQQRRWRTTAG